jgi:hypothetical protein
MGGLTGMSSKFSDAVAQAINDIHDETSTICILVPDQLGGRQH